MEKEIHTAGAPASIQLKADRSSIRADGRDLSFVTATILDKNGYPCRMPATSLHFSVEGNGRLTATDNGYQADPTSFKSPQRKCWKGLALAIVQSTEKREILQ